MGLVVTTFLLVSFIFSNLRFSVTLLGSSIRHFYLATKVIKLKELSIWVLIHQNITAIKK